MQTGEADARPAKRTKTTPEARGHHADEDAPVRAAVERAMDALPDGTLFSLYRAPESGPPSLLALCGRRLFSWERALARLKRRWRLGPMLAPRMFLTSSFSCDGLPLRAVDDRWALRLLCLWAVIGLVNRGASASLDGPGIGGRTADPAAAAHPPTGDLSFLIIAGREHCGRANDRAVVVECKGSAGISLVADVGDAILVEAERAEAIRKERASTITRRGHVWADPVWVCWDDGLDFVKVYGFVDGDPLFCARGYCARGPDGGPSF